MNKSCCFIPNDSLINSTLTCINCNSMQLCAVMSVATPTVYLFSLVQRSVAYRQNLNIFNNKDAFTDTQQATSDKRQAIGDRPQFVIVPCLFYFAV